jgi:hypothetical protein
MPTMDRDEIRAKQLWLIARAGMSISSAEMSITDIQKAMLDQFKAHVIAYKLPPNLTGLDKDRFFRTAKHVNDEMATAGDSRHTGVTLWRKFADIKKVISTVFTPIYAKILGKDGLPSGKSMAEILLKTRVAIFDYIEDTAMRASKSQKRVKKPFHDSWYPLEWDIFITYGMPSNNPEKVFFAE